MEPLDEPRIRKFAGNAGVTDTDAFIAAVEHGNLWHFAGRPLDLEWMAKYWHDHHKLGTLQQMLEASIAARLIDPKPDRRRRDTLSPQVARNALERIAAALHLSGKETVRLPSASLDSQATPNALSIQSVLPEWPAKDQLQLLGRPVFDPATLGRIRLHNDNEGSVRTYLTACWLHGRLADNCPLREIHDLLFADIYGRALIRPDMVEVGAWLSIWHPTIADKVIERDPYILLTRGDPGSLPVATRVRAIEASIALAGHHDPWHLFGDDLFRRLADPTFDPLIPEWWGRFAKSRHARHLLLRLIRLGRQQGGLDIARQVAFEDSVDDISQILAGMILVEMGTDEDKRRLADYILTDFEHLQRDIVLSAVEGLFPTFLPVEQFFSVIDVLGVTDGQNFKSIHPIGPDLAAALNTRDELIEFLAAVVDRIGPLTGNDDECKFTEAFAELAIAAAVRLLALCQSEVPPVVTQFVLRLHDHQAYRGVGPTEDQLNQAMVATTIRKQMSFWQAAEALREHPWFVDKPAPNVWQMQHLGWPGRLGPDDLDWLLTDMISRADPGDRLLALGAAHAISRESGDAALLARTGQAAAVDADLLAAHEQWQKPIEESPELKRSHARLEKSRRENQKRTAERDDSWIRFIDELRADPGQLDSLHPQTEDTVDRRLYNLWRLLNSRTSSRSRYSVSDVSAIEPIVGKEVAEKLRLGLIDFAHRRMPRIPSELPPDERNGTKGFDIMGLAGTSLAAAATPQWAMTLSDSDTERAARYAIVELNGFPDYMVSLANVKPDLVAPILNAEIDSQLNDGNPAAHGMLDRITYCEQPIAELVTPHLRTRLTTERDVPPAMLPKVADVLTKTAGPGDTEFGQDLRAMALCANSPEAAAIYLALLFAIDGDDAIDCLEILMQGHDGPARSALCAALLPRVVGGRFRQERPLPPTLSFKRLLALVRAAFEGIRREDDVDRPSGEVYSPGERDHAQDARNALFNRLAETPGEATHAALIEMACKNDIDIEPDWLRELARRRALADAALQPWRAKDVLQFETEFGKPPSTTADLQFLAVRRIEQIEHDLLNGRFSQGTTLQELSGENAVQRWIADRLESLQPQLYTLVREPHVADEKEPDITLHSRITGVALPIEIKVLEAMSVVEMEKALEEQLCGQYLRHDTARHGILLFVHQKSRSQGWQLAGHSQPVQLPAVLEHLRKRASSIRATSPTGPQPVVCCIDVSGVRPLKRKPARRKRSGKQPLAK
ncbi:MULTISPECIES: hypothetical protein [Pacificimonas]|nr:MULTISPECIES: hypothetical protein [Pacificimonas]MBZ6380092.1 hypothetical protein [Pacificimonas aurantium]